MNNRRDFLKATATGAVLLGSQRKLGLATMLDPHAKHAEPTKSKVVVARDLALHNASGQLDDRRVLDLLDRTMIAYTGHEKLIEAWRDILPQGALSSKVIGLKTNGLGGKGISTHLALVLAICERLQQAGVKPGNIIVWDRNARDLEACGLTINTDPSRVRCFGSDVSGYEEEPVAFGAAVNIKLSKILTRECDIVIGLPILKDHSMAGVTFAMKNMYGVVQHPQELHGGGCNPYVADLNCIPAVRKKVRFTIGDATSAVFDGGPGFHPERLWQPNALIVGEDRVAIDHTAWQMLERKRAEAGMPTFEAAGRPPRYIATAADAAHRLGVDDPARIHLMEI
jgi:uncharacterized protein (DUF362 family)